MPFSLLNYFTHSLVQIIGKIAPLFSCLQEFLMQLLSQHAKLLLLTAACRPGLLNQHNAKWPINLIYLWKPPTGKTNQANEHSLWVCLTKKIRFKQVNTLTMATTVCQCLNIMIGLSYKRLLNFTEEQWSGVKSQEVALFRECSYLTNPFILRITSW